MHIKTISDLRRAARIKYAWPGGYPTYFVCHDGESLCHGCMSTERRGIIDSVAHKRNDGWRVVGLDINWEDSELHCAHCGTLIESAYGE